MSCMILFERCRFNFKRVRTSFNINIEMYMVMLFNNVCMYEQFRWIDDLQRAKCPVSTATNEENNEIRVYLTWAEGSSELLS